MAEGAINGCTQRCERWMHVACVRRIEMSNSPEIHLVFSINCISALACVCVERRRRAFICVRIHDLWPCVKGKSPHCLPTPHCSTIHHYAWTSCRPTIKIHLHGLLFRCVVCLRRHNSCQWNVKMCMFVNDLQYWNSTIHCWNEH